MGATEEYHKRMLMPKSLLPSESLRRQMVGIKNGKCGNEGSTVGQDKAHIMAKGSNEGKDKHLLEYWIAEGIASHDNDLLMEDANSKEKEQGATSKEPEKQIMEICLTRRWGACAKEISPHIRRKMSSSRIDGSAI